MLASVDSEGPGTEALDTALSALGLDSAKRSRGVRHVANQILPVFDENGEFYCYKLTERGEDNWKAESVLQSLTDVYQAHPGQATGFDMPEELQKSFSAQARPLVVALWSSFNDANVARGTDSETPFTIADIPLRRELYLNWDDKLREANRVETSDVGWLSQLSSLFSLPTWESHQPSQQDPDDTGSRGWGSGLLSYVHNLWTPTEINDEINDESDDESDDGIDADFKILFGKGEALSSGPKQAGNEHSRGQNIQDAW